MSTFQIRKDNFAVSRVVEDAALNAASPLAVGEVLVKIDRFAITANNITYAVTGDKLGYWQFFPTMPEDAHIWGILPVWGFADVVASSTDGIEAGERLYGYFPPAKWLKMQPVRATSTRLFDGAPHRAALPPGYNSYSRVLAEPNYDRRFDDVRALLWPLHMTSFCLGDLLQSKKYFDAAQIIILSASSKTSIGLGYALQADQSAPKVIALTSAKNGEFVSKLGVYAHTISYADVARIDANLPTVIVDMSGNAELLTQLQTHLGDNMRRCINVGLTHWQDGALDAKPTNTALAERSEFFFAPGHIQTRMKEWGVEEFSRRTSAFLRDAATKSMSSLVVKKLDGLQGLAAVFDDVCAGKIPPEQGLIVEM